MIAWLNVLVQTIPATEGTAMNILIAGDGKVGTALTKQLSDEGYAITLIDSNPKVLENSQNRFDVMTIHGNCATLETLRRAGVDKADLLIAVTSADEVNLLCCMAAHGMNPKLHTIARIRTPEYDELLVNMRETFALSLTINPDKQAAMEINRLLKYPGFLKRETFGRGLVEIVQLRINPDSVLDGCSLMDLQKVIDCRVLVCGVMRNGKTITPRGDTVLHAGDQIYVTASTDSLTKLLRSIGIVPKKSRHVMLLGCGRIGFYLCSMLVRSGIDVRIIEKDVERCKHLAEHFPTVSVIAGDANDQELLENEGISSCDAVICMTDMDEFNMMSALYASSRNVPNVVTKLAHVESQAFLDQLPLGSIVNPKELCTSVIVQYVRALKNQTGAALSVHSIANGQLEAVEFRADNKTLHCGIPLKHLKLKKNVLIACIIHPGKIEIPNGDSIVQEGDLVVVVSGEDLIINQLNDIFADER